MTTKLEKIGAELGKAEKKAAPKKAPAKTKKAAPKKAVAPKKPITMEDLSPELIQAIVDKVTVKGGQNFKPVQPGIGSQVFMEEGDTDINDVLAEPAVFFSYGLGKTIMDDKRNGRIVVPPFSHKNDKGEVIAAKYVFTKQYATEKQGSNRDARKLWICTLVERSKARAEWLRRHTMFNIAFFEDIKKIQSVDVVMQDKLVEASMSVKRLNDSEVVWRCQNETPPIPMSSNIEDMRSSLTNRIAMKEFQNMSGRTSSNIKNYMEAIDSIGKDGRSKGMLIAK